MALDCVSLVMFRSLYVGGGSLLFSQPFEIILRVSVATLGGRMGMDLLAHSALGHGNDT